MAGTLIPSAQAAEEEERRQHIAADAKEQARLDVERIKADADARQRECDACLTRAKAAEDEAALAV
jgi:hypothetical protein